MASEIGRRSRERFLPSVVCIAVAPQYVRSELGDFLLAVHSVEMAIAASGDEGSEEDGEVVARVDECRCENRAKADAHRAKDE